MGKIHSLYPPVPRAPGAWNLTRSGELRQGVARAVALATARVPHLARVASLIIPLMPGRPQVSYTLKSDRPSSWRELLWRAVDAPWIAYNTAEATNALTIDVDHDDYDLVAAAVARGVPPPVMTVINPASGHFQVTWWLADPVRTYAGAAAEPQHLLQRARDLARLALRGDPGMVNRLTRCPWAVWDADEPRPVPVTLAEQALADMASPLRHVAVDEGGGAVRLADLVASLAPWVDELDDERTAAAPTRRKAANDNPEGRNCGLFDRLRLWAYPRVERDAAVIRAQAHIFNDYADPLPPKEVDQVARSVTRFMVNDYQGVGRADGKNRGVMGLAGSGLPLEQRQRLAGQYGPRQRRAKTDGAVFVAAVALRDQGGPPPTQRRLAEVAGVSIDTIKRRWQAVLAHLATVPAAAPGAAPPPAETAPAALPRLVADQGRPVAPAFLSAPYSASEVGGASKVANGVPSGYAGGSGGPPAAPRAPRTGPRPSAEQCRGGEPRGSAAGQGGEEGLVPDGSTLPLGHPPKLEGLGDGQTPATGVREERSDDAVGRGRKRLRAAGSG